MLPPGPEVAHGGIGLVEAGLKVGGGWIGGLVAVEVYGPSGLGWLCSGGRDAVELCVYKGGELRCYGGWEEGVLLVIWDCASLHGYEGFGGGALGGCGFGVDVWKGKEESC